MCCFTYCHFRFGYCWSSGLYIALGHYCHWLTRVWLQYLFPVTFFIHVMIMMYFCVFGQECSYQVCILAILVKSRYPFTAYLFTVVKKWLILLKKKSAVLFTSRTYPRSLAAPSYWKWQTTDVFISLLVTCNVPEDIVGSLWKVGP